MVSSRLRSWSHRFLLLFLAGLATLHASGQTRTQTLIKPSHGLWVWKTPAVLATPADIEALRNFCRSEHINEVYLSFSSNGGPEGRAKEDALLSGVIRQLHESGIHAEALLSSADADEAGKPREKLLNEIREVIQFNRSHTGSAFDGIHLDIEPQQRPENKGPGNFNFLPGLVETYRAARKLTAPARLTINADIPIKLLKGDLNQRRSLLTALPSLTLMLYQLSSPGDGASPEEQQAKLLAKTRETMQMAYEGLGRVNFARLAIGLRTPDYKQRIPRMLQAIDNAEHANPHYLGWAWHSWNDHE